MLFIHQESGSTTSPAASVSSTASPVAPTELDENKSQDITPKLLPMESNPQGKMGCVELQELEEAKRKSLEPEGKPVPVETKSAAAPTVLAKDSLVALAMKKRMAEKLLFSCNSGLHLGRFLMCLWCSG